jgi:3-oxoacid CoA-transferase
MIGGFGTCGLPECLIKAVADTDVKGLTTVSNDVGTDTCGISIWRHKRQVKRHIVSGIWFSKAISDMYGEGGFELELTPQGTLAERIRCGGLGIPAFFTPTAAGTVIEEGGFPLKVNPEDPTKPLVTAGPRESREFGGRKYLMEEAITGDVALVKAMRGDTFGNLQFHATARNFNPLVAMAGKIAIAEVEELVEPGVIPPDDVHLPGIFIQRIFQGKDYEKPLTYKRTRDVAVEGAEAKPVKSVADMRPSEIIARRAAFEYKDGMIVNLGIGIPTQSGNYVPADVHITLQSENGVMHVGPYPTEEELDVDLVNAGTETVTVLPGASMFDSATSFGMIRGQHVDVTVLGGMQVSEFGDLANWVIPGVMVKGMGGAMDLVSSGSRVVVTMQHCDKKGNAKIMPACTLPLTGKSVVSRIITDLAVFDVDKSEGLTLVEKREGVTLETLRAKTAVDFKVVEPVMAMRIL